MVRQLKPRPRKSSPKASGARPAVAVKITDMLGEDVLTLHTV